MTDLEEARAIVEKYDDIAMSVFEGASQEEAALEMFKFWQICKPSWIRCIFKTEQEKEFRLKKIHLWRK
jgi:hypothetical protein